MKPKQMFLYIFLLGMLLMAIPWPLAAQKKQVDVIKINDAITPATADFISKSIEQAVKNRAECLVIQMDTPGGLDMSMRDIIKDIMNADIPVVVYVDLDDIDLFFLGAQRQGMERRKTPSIKIKPNKHFLFI
jgi:membrane-bound serine protease (ClpP class)